MLGALLGSGLGLACNTSTDVKLETYGDEAAEDYGCILGDLECGCAAGNTCDLGLECVSGTCKCTSGDCEPVGPMTSSSSDGDSGTADTMGSETMATDTAGTDTMGTTTGTTGTDTGTESSTDTTTDTTTGTTTDTGGTTTDTGTDTGGTTTDTGTTG